MTSGGTAQLAAEQAAQRRRDRNLLVAAAVALVVLVVGAGIGVPAYRTKRAPSAAGVTATVADAPQPVVDGQPIRFGPDTARATVTVYEDFHCPHCADFEEEFGPVLTAAQTDGVARVELYPMSFRDAGSVSAANAMACATEAGFGRGYHQGLFANASREWSEAQLSDLAGLVGGSSTGGFGTCVSTRARAGWAASINAAANRAGVTGTPTVFLNGAPVDLASLTPQSLRAMIDSAPTR